MFHPLFEMSALNNYLFTNYIIYLFPNLVISIRIFLTLPVTVASEQKKFSKQKFNGTKKAFRFSIISIEKKAVRKYGCVLHF